MLLFSGFPASAQEPFPPGGGLPRELKDYLLLTDSQEQRVLRNNQEYYRWNFEKRLRMTMVQDEIATETGREVLDANALGVRYVELESICREIIDRWAGFRTLNIEVLNQEQKAKLKVLKEAVRLATIVAQAQSQNLLAGNQSGYFVGGFLVAGTPGPPMRCDSPYAAFRAGDFLLNASGNASPRR